MERMITPSTLNFRHTINVMDLNPQLIEFIVLTTKKGSALRLGSELTTTKKCLICGVEEDSFEHALMKCKDLEDVRIGEDRFTIALFRVSLGIPELPIFWTTRAVDNLGSILDAEDVALRLGVLSEVLLDYVKDVFPAKLAEVREKQCVLAHQVLRSSRKIWEERGRIIEARTQTEAVLTGEEFSRRKEEWTERRKRKAKGVTMYKKGHTATRGEGLKITFSKVYVETRTPFAKKRQKVDLTKKRPNVDRSEGSEEEVLQWLTKKRPKPKD